MTFFRFRLTNPVTVRPPPPGGGVALPFPLPFKGRVRAGMGLCHAAESVRRPGEDRSRGGLLSISLILLISVLSCSGKAKQAPPPPPSVTVIQPIPKTVTDYLELTGNTQAIKTVQLVARVAGYLDKLFFQDGQLVKEGQLLFLIQQNTYQDNLRQAEASISQYKAQLDYAEAQFTRYSNLLEQKAASQSDVDNWRYQRDLASANLHSSEAQRDLAKLNLDYTEVRAPFDGRIDRRQKDPGNLVGSGENTLLAEINQINPIYVYFNISDADLARLIGEAHWNPGQGYHPERAAFAAVLNEEGFPHEGHIDFASITLTPTTGTLLLRAIFPNADAKILPGLYARLHVPVTERSALLVPDEAIGEDQRGSYLLTVNENHVVQRVGVKTGALVDHLRVIREGLTGNEWVVTEGVQKAIPSRKVTPERPKGSPPANSVSRPSSSPLTAGSKKGRRS